MWGDHRAVTHCTCRQGRLGLLALLMMIMIPLGGGRPSLQLVSFLCMDEVIWWGGERLSREDERREGEEDVTSVFLVENRNIFATCLLYFFIYFEEKGMEGQVDGEES